MAQITETRRRRAAPTGSQENISGENAPEYIQPEQVFNQALWLAARYDVGAAHARVLAEHAFARRSPR